MDVRRGPGSRGVRQRVRARGSELPIGVFVIEYLDTNTYRVRVIDTATGELGLPLNLRDKSQTVDEVMTAVSRTAVFEPTNQLLFTLYQDARRGWRRRWLVHPHARPGQWCLVPRRAEELGLADNPGALAVSPDGSRLFAASSIGGVAGYSVSDITHRRRRCRRARVTTAVDANGTTRRDRSLPGRSDRRPGRLALPSRSGRRSRCATRSRGTWMSRPSTVLDDGSAVIVGTGRMTLVSPDNELVAERLAAGERRR